MITLDELKTEIKELKDHIRENKDLLIRAYRDKDHLWIIALKEGISRQEQNLVKLNNQFTNMVKSPRPWFPPLANNRGWDSDVQDGSDFDEYEDEAYCEPIGLLPRGNPIPAKKCECGAHAIGFADPGPWHNDKCPLWEAK